MPAWRTSAIIRGGEGNMGTLTRKDGVVAVIYDASQISEWDVSVLLKLVNDYAVFLPEGERIKFYQFFEEYIVNGNDSDAAKRVYLDVLSRSAIKLGLRVKYNFFNQENILEQKISFVEVEAWLPELIQLIIETKEGIKIQDLELDNYMSCVYKKGVLEVKLKNVANKVIYDIA